MTRSRPIIAVYDANVLYPASLRDLLIRLARTGIVSARWTARIQDEWIRNLLQNRPDLSPAQLQRTRELMEIAVPGAVVEEYERRIHELSLPDQDDRHVLAAAIEAGAEVIQKPPRSVEEYLTDLGVGGLKRVAEAFRQVAADL